jgi:MFS family permease
MTANPPSSRTCLILFAVCASACTMFMAITDVLASVPAIGAGLRAGQTQLQWIGDCYPLVLATLLLPAGVLADRFGRKTLLLSGLTVLTAALVGASQARSAPVLIACLCAAGAGSGLSFPSTLATITGAVPEARRRIGVSLWAAAVPAGGITGALIAGAVVEVASWHIVFLVTAGIATACLLFTALFVPETRDPGHTDLDVRGTVLSAGTVACLVMGLTEGPAEGWASAVTLGGLGSAVALLIAFIYCELHTERPLLDVRLFKIRAFGAGVAAMFLLFAGLFAIVFLGYQWESYVLGWHALKAGLGLIPCGFLMLPLALVSTTLASRVGLKTVLAAALACACGGSFIMAFAGQTSSYWTLAIGLFVFGAAIGLSSGPGTDAISRALPAARQGVASAVNDLARELGSTLGIAVSGTAFNIGYRAHIAGHIHAAADPIANAILTSPATGVAAIAHSGRLHASYLHALTAATNTGWTVAVFTVCVAFALGFVMFLKRFPGREPRRSGSPGRSWSWPSAGASTRR